MSEILVTLYPWIKVIHILAVISWMAGLLYLPRLFVNHVEKGEKTPQIIPVFIEMEQKLLRIIMNPAMIVAWIAGLLLVSVPGVVDWGAGWPYSKLVGILGMTWFHHWLGRRRKELAAGENLRSGRDFRIMNEVPTLFMVIIVISVIARPF
ncbi:CopD family protein [Alphaproteobacteria bacterium KMM 3653]|uniref:Protoporphyrinogen IX oxidase n=1 Tax=Harenicola maris TaxID=2841044 RepID=A0AAP2CSE1_9RHOB|nr:CopD family protein [Harenicola maris]